MEKLISFLIWAFRLVEGRITENVCKVMTVATLAGFLFSVACVEGPYMWRAIFFGAVCLMLACFFGSMVMMYEEVCE